MTPNKTRALEALRDKWRKNGEATRLIKREESVELRASDAQMKEIHQNWNRMASKCSGDDSLWHTIEAIAEIMFRQVPAQRQWGQPNPAGCSMLTCADELDAELRKLAEGEPAPPVKESVSGYGTQRESAARPHLIHGPTTETPDAEGVPKLKVYAEELRYILEGEKDNAERKEARLWGVLIGIEQLLAAAPATPPAPPQEFRRPTIAELEQIIKDNPRADDVWIKPDGSVLVAAPPPAPTFEEPQQCWIRAVRLPSGKDQHAINVRVRDDYTEHDFVMEPEDVLQLVYDHENRVWRAPDISLTKTMEKT